MSGTMCRFSFKSNVQWYVSLCSVSAKSNLHQSTTCNIETERQTERLAKRQTERQRIWNGGGSYKRRSNRSQPIRARFHCCGKHRPDVIERTKRKEKLFQMKKLRAAHFPTFDFEMRKTKCPKICSRDAIYFAAWLKHGTFKQHL